MGTLPKTRLNLPHRKTHQTPHPQFRHLNIQKFVIDSNFQISPVTLSPCHLVPVSPLPSPIFLLTLICYDAQQTPPQQMKRFLQISCLLLLNSAQIAFAAQPPSTQPLFVINFHWPSVDDAILLETTWKGKPADFVFDTGAEICCVDSAFFPSLRPTNQDFDAETTGGSKTFQKFDPPDLSFGPLHLRDAGSVVSTDLTDIRKKFDSPVVGILGNNVWRKLIIQIDFDAGQLRFFSPDDLPHSEWGIAIPLEFPERSDGSHFPTPGIRLNIGGFEDLFILDTGAIGGYSGTIPSEGFDYILSKTKFPVAPPFFCDSISAGPLNAPVHPHPFFHHC